MRKPFNSLTFQPSSVLSSIVVESSWFLGEYHKILACNFINSNFLDWKLISIYRYISGVGIAIAVQFVPERALDG